MLIENKVTAGVELHHRSKVEMVLCTASEIMKTRYQDAFTKSKYSGLIGSYHNSVTTATTPNGAIGLILRNLRLEHRKIHGMCVVGELSFSEAGGRDIRNRLRTGTTFAPRIIGKDLITFDMVGDKV